jgi:hypothetical protein
VIVAFEDIMPHAPIWFTVSTERDESAALYEEIARLDMLFTAEEDIPEPPKPRTYAEVVSDSEN